MVEIQQNRGSPENRGRSYNEKKLIKEITCTFDFGNGTKFHRWKRAAPNKQTNKKPKPGIISEEKF